MPQNVIALADHGQVTDLRLAILSLIARCRDFASEVADAEAECGAMPIVEIERHQIYLRELERKVRSAKQ